MLYLYSFLSVSYVLRDITGAIIFFRSLHDVFTTTRDIGWGDTILDSVLRSKAQHAHLRSQSHLSFTYIRCSVQKSGAVAGTGMMDNRRFNWLSKRKAGVGCRGRNTSLTARHSVATATRTSRSASVFCAPRDSWCCKTLLISD